MSQASLLFTHPLLLLGLPSPLPSLSSALLRAGRGVPALGLQTQTCAQKAVQGALADGNGPKRTHIFFKADTGWEVCSSLIQEVFIKCLLYARDSQVLET